jgi:hypothetical protein
MTADLRFLLYILAMFNSHADQRASSYGSLDSGVVLALLE